LLDLPGNLVSSSEFLVHWHERLKTETLDETSEGFAKYLHRRHCMPINHYVTLGGSGLRVSPFCLGAMTFGEEWGIGSSVETSQQILDRFLDRGGNFIDTANFYTRGHSEKIIGDHIGRYPARRDRVVIATKFFGNFYPGDPNAGGSNRKGIFSACEHSLRRLQTDYIDLYWVHVWDRFTPVEETLRALDDLVRCGKVRYIGFSDTPAWKVAEAQVTARLRGWVPLIALQIEYSLLERTVEGELFPMARELGLGVTPFAPLKGGLLSGKYTRANVAQAPAGRAAAAAKALDEQGLRVIDVLAEIARQLATTPAQVALAWTLSRPGVSSTIIGSRTLEQLDANLPAVDLQLRTEHFAALEEVSRPKLNWPGDIWDNVGSTGYGGTTINGRSFPVNPRAPKSEAERY
jgi:aryl-alcohol dehydrogenase-like predicted oxidoreductase